MSFIFDIGAAKQAGAIGNYNQQVQERNAQVKEQEAAQVEKQLEFDLVRFDQQFERLEGETKTKILFSGADLSGSGLRIMRYNAEQAELQKDIMEYNAKIGQSQKMEEASFARIQGSLAKMEARQAQLGYYAKAGQSLLSLGSSFGGGSSGGSGGGLVVAP